MPLWLFENAVLLNFAAGELTQGELYSAMKKEKEQTEGDGSTTHFSGEMHFYELVEDTKDGIDLAGSGKAVQVKQKWLFNI